MADQPADIAVRDLVQVNPDVPMFGACIVVVTEVRSWGVIGYVKNAGSDGLAFIRLSFDKVEKVGRAVWVRE